MEHLWEGLSRRPADPVMFARLREHLEQASNWAGLVRLYAQRADVVGPEEALLLHLTIAELWAPRVQDQVAVRDSVRAAMALGEGLGEEGLAQMRESLKELFWARGDWHGMAELLEREATQSVPGAEGARRWMELAELRGAKLGEVHSSAEAYRQAAALPEAPVREIRRRLQDMWSQHPERAEVFEALREVYQRSLSSREDALEFMDLLASRTRALEAQGEPVERQDLLMEMGRTCALHLGDAQQALLWFEEAHKLGAHAEDIVGSLEALLEKVGDQVELLGALRVYYEEMSRWEV